MKTLMTTLCSYPKDYATYLKEELALCKKHKKGLLFIFVATIVFELAFAALNAYQLKKSLDTFKVDDDLDEE